MSNDFLDTENFVCNLVYCRFWCALPISLLLTFGFQVREIRKGFASRLTPDNC
jgi:hypothetical protein